MDTSQIILKKLQEFRRDTKQQLKHISNDIKKTNNS